MTGTGPSHAMAPDLERSNRFTSSFLKRREHDWQPEGLDYHALPDLRMS